jgi:hypothetical protein
MTSSFAGEISAMWVAHGATASLVRCSFAGNKITDEEINSAILSVNAVDSSDARAQLQDTIVRLHQCTFRDIEDNLLLTNRGSDSFDAYAAHVYSDNTSLEVLRVSDNGDDTAQGFAEPLSAAPARRQGLTGTSAWLQSIQQVRSPAAFRTHTPRLVTNMNLACTFVGTPWGKGFGILNC